MKYARLGKTSCNISRIGFGCMSLSTDKAAGEKLLQQAVAMGINYFDTADLYDKGENERIVGAALKQKRKEVVLATKVGNQWREDGSGWDWNPRKEYIVNAVEESLRRLQTDYIDLYQLHGGTMDDNCDEVVEAFELLQQQGKILYYGISSIRPNVIRQYVQRSHISSVMMQYSLLDRRPEETCLHLLQQNNISVMARGSIAQGLLVNKPAKAYLKYSAEEISLAAQAVKAVSGEKRSEAQTALQYVLSHAAVTAAIVGIRTEEQLKDAVGTMDVPFLNADELQQLKEAIVPNIYEEHR